jgi:hypothetical protein
MSREELIVLIIALALLFICYFSPLRNSSKDSREGFGNAQDGISLIKSDGVILGGYVPQIIRPFDSVSDSVQGSGCNEPCYTGRKYQTWCNEDNAINYYAMRPIISNEKYLENINKMFKMIKDPIKTKIPKDVTTPKNAVEFCEQTQTSMMAWLMEKIAIAVSKMPEMQRNGSWKSERFYETDVQMFEFVKDSLNVYQIIFNLYNPLRSVANQVFATVLVVKENGKQMPYLVDIGFSSGPIMGDYQCPQNGFGAINGHNVDSKIVQFEPLGLPNSPEGMKEYAENYLKDPNEFDWNYMNTLEVQKFNEHGFHSNNPKDNIEIEGGVPESLRDALGKCSENILSDCFTPRFTGFVGAVSAKTMNDVADLKKVDGRAVDVYAYPTVAYDLGDRRVEIL